MGKSTDAEMEQRISDVYNLLLLGTSRPAILQYASKWKVDPRSVDTYIRRAKAEIKRHAKTQREAALGLARARLELLFQKALTAKDIRGALAVQKELNALADLYPPPPQTLKGLLAESGAPVDRAFWSAILHGLKTAGLDPAEVLNVMLQKLEEVNEDGAAGAKARG